MITAPSDSWIESSHDPNIAFDDAGYCEECGFHLDSGRCECTLPDLSGSCESGISETTRESAVHADCLAAITENNPATVRIRPAQNLSDIYRPDPLPPIQVPTPKPPEPEPRGPRIEMRDIRDLQDKLGAEPAGLVWALKQLDRYLK